MLKKSGFEYCFEDTKCKTCKGFCCTGEGFVFLNNEDIARIARFLNTDSETFLKLYTRSVNGKFALIDLVIKNEIRCVFLDDNYQCEIYPVRPEQCRTFPFWESLKNRPLKEVKRLCPGVVPCM